MSRCEHCNKQLSCTCEKVTASDGAIVCRYCIYQYELNLKALKK